MSDYSEINQELELDRLEKGERLIFPDDTAEYVYKELQSTRQQLKVAVEGLKKMKKDVCYCCDSWHTAEEILAMIKDKP